MKTEQQAKQEVFDDLEYNDFICYFDDEEKLYEKLKKKHLQK